MKFLIVAALCLLGEWIVTMAFLAYLVMWYLPVDVLGLGWTKRILVWAAYYLLWHPRRLLDLRRWGIWDYWRNSYMRTRFLGPGAELLSQEGGFSYEKKVIFACHPHGYDSAIVVIGLVLNKAMLRITPVCNSIFFWIPLSREVVNWARAIPANEPDMKRALATSAGLLQVPGGPVEMEMRGDDIKERYGFIRVAREAGASVIPVWSPDEHYCYRIWQPLGNLLLKSPLRYGFPVFAWGRAFLPRPPPRGARIYIGRPVDMDPAESLEEAKDRVYDEMRRLQAMAREDAEK